ncbi:hypothetical protein JOL62DRAFT_41100 [Phyllosticta paracitricarpa]|uniref:Uncharacterized protein n=1 Tax=Phyllosticta paracitricarpa TaxID=2016321 RepID=A0ABR1NAL2_9PEZI
MDLDLDHCAALPAHEPCRKPACHVGFGFGLLPSSLGDRLVNYHPSNMYSITYPETFQSMIVSLLWAACSKVRNLPAEPFEPWPEGQSGKRCHQSQKNVHDRTGHFAVSAPHSPVLNCLVPDILACAYVRDARLCLRIRHMARLFARARRPGASYRAPPWTRHWWSSLTSLGLARVERCSLEHRWAAHWPRRQSLGTKRQSTSVAGDATQSEGGFELVYSGRRDWAEDRGAGEERVRRLRRGFGGFMGVRASGSM